MFDSMVGRGPAGDEPVAPMSPAVSDVSVASDACAAAPSTVSWREAAPGPEMIAGLAGVSLQACADEQLLDVLAGWERAAAWLDAQRLRALARTETRLIEAAVRDERELNGNVSWTAVHRQAETEIATALHWTSWQTLPRLRLARDLTDRHPQVLDAMTAGQLSCKHADVISDETDTLTEIQAARIVERVLPEATSKNTIWLRRRLRQAVLQLDPRAANERAAKAVTERGVTIRPLRDGLMSMEAIGPAEAILAMFQLLNDTANRHHKDDPRTTTARRFDALVDFVLTGFAAGSPFADPTTSASTSAPTSDTTFTPGTTSTTTGPTTGDSTTTGDCTATGDGSAAGFPTGPTTGRATGAAAGCPPRRKVPALVQITMDLETLLGLRDNPAELHGYGPLPANLARALAMDADWQRFIQDPLTGAPRDLGRTRRHPGADLRRWIIARDKTCLFPDVRREALVDRVEVRDLRRSAVAAGL